jgi:hypothetical protein
VLHFDHRHLNVFSLSKRISQRHVLSGQFEQHGIVEEFVDRHILTETLATPRFHHKLSSQMRRRLRLQRPQEDTLVQWIARNDLPVMKDGQTESLSLGVGS